MPVPLFETTRELAMPTVSSIQTSFPRVELLMPITHLAQRTIIGRTLVYCYGMVLQRMDLNCLTVLGVNLTITTRSGIKPALFLN